MLYKKATSPVVAMALLLVVAVVAVIGFQGWFQTYSSDLFVQTEKGSSSTSNTNIETLVGDQLYFKNTFDENISIKQIKIGNKECNISLNLTNGVHNISLGNCVKNLTLNSNVEDIVVITDKQIYTKKHLFKDAVIASSSSINYLYRLNSTLIEFSNKNDYIQEDVKQSCTKFVVDTENVSGHFTNDLGVSQTLGVGNDCEKIVAGTRMKINDEWYNIISINGDGSGTDDVNFDGNLNLTGEQLVDYNEGSILTDATGRNSEMFDGITNEAEGSSTYFYPSSPYSGYGGKDWGEGNEKRITKVVVWPSNDDGFVWAMDTSNINISFLASNSNDIFNAVLLGNSGNFVDTDGLSEKTIINESTNLYRYYWVKVFIDNLPMEFQIAEVQFYELKQEPYDVELVYGTQINNNLNFNNVEIEGSNDVCTGGTASSADQYYGLGPTYAFNDNLGDRWVSGSNGASTSWLRYDLPSSKMVYQYRLYDTTVHSAEKWDFEGWNGSSWIKHDTISASALFTGGNKWVYFNVSNPTFYSKYRFNFNVAPFDSNGDGSVWEVDMFEKEIFLPINNYLTTIHNIDTLNINSISNISVDETLNGEKSFYSLSFDNGNSFKIYNGSNWNSIARNNVGNWQYLDNSKTWQNANINNMNNAISQAINLSILNQMNKSQLENLSNIEFDLEYSNNLDLAITLNSMNSNNNPQINLVKINYNESYVE